MNARTMLKTAGVALMTLPLVVGAAAPALAGTPVAGAYGDAYGLMVDVTAVSGNVPVAVGPRPTAGSSCPLTGGTKTATELSVGGAPVPAKAEVLKATASADCTAKKGAATAQVTNVDALDGTPAAIHADAVTATSTTTCTAAPKGSLSIVNLVVGGHAITLPDVIKPNTLVADPVLSVAGLTIILNEQHPAAAGRGLVVNGIHIIASGTGTLPIGGTVLRGDIVISHAVSGVVCPGGPGSDLGGLPAPDITFQKSASPSVAGPGATVTYTALVTNTSKVSCEVLRFVDHIAPAFNLVSTSGPLGTKLQSPAPTRTDGGVDAVLHPTGVKLGAGKSLTQTFTVTVKDGATPGTYYDMLEIYCGPNGDFVSGPLAPVTVPGTGVPPVPPTPPVIGHTSGPGTGPVAFGRTGLSTGVAGTAVLLLLAGAAVRRLRLTQ